jgi:hypothetical protein
MAGLIDYSMATKQPDILSGIKMLNESLDDIATRKRQYAMDVMAKEKYDLEMGEKRRAIQEDLAIANALKESQAAGGTPDEQYARLYEGLKGANIGAAKLGTTLKDVAELNKISPQQIQLDRQKAARTSLDTTMKSIIDYKKQGKPMAALMKGAIVSDLQKGLGIDATKAEEAFNQMYNSLNVNEIGEIEVKDPTGNLLGKVVQADDGKGGMWNHFVPVKEDKYMSRQRPEGRQVIFEESYDSGKTWKEVSRGDKDSPFAGISLQTARETAQGVVMSGPYAGQMAYKDSRKPKDPPFVFQKDRDGNTITVPIPGVPLDARASAAAYAGTETPTGEPELTPAQKKANLKSQTDPTAMRIVKRIDGVIPVLNKIKAEFASLPGETGFVPLNKALRAGNVMLGGVKIDSYETFVKEATREVQSALSGNQSSQKLVLQQIDVLKAAKTNAQRAAAIDAIITTLSERKNAELSVPYTAPKLTGKPAGGSSKFKIISVQ